MTVISVPLLQLHEFDDLRFDIRVHDCTYFFRASTHEEKALWIEVVEENKVICCCLLSRLLVSTNTSLVWESVVAKV